MRSARGGLVLGVGAALVVAACSSDPQTRYQQEQAGSVAAGAVIGGLIGSTIGGGTGRVVATAAGAAVGGYVGNVIFKKNAKSPYEAEAFVKAMNGTRSGQRLTWVDPSTGENGWVEPTDTRRNTSNQVCRDFKRGLSVGGETVDQSQGTACQQKNGSWNIVS
jgi:surface antigen